MPPGFRLELPSQGTPLWYRASFSGPIAGGTDAPQLRRVRRRIRSTVSPSSDSAYHCSPAEGPWLLDTTTWGSEARMVYLALGTFIVLVVGLTWLSSRRQQRSAGCCAPADPRDDLRMRAAFDEDTNGRQPDPPRP